MSRRAALAPILVALGCVSQIVAIAVDSLALALLGVAIYGVAVGLAIQELRRRAA